VLVVDNRAAIGDDNPGLHALLIGLSDYPHLSHKGDPNPNTPFGFFKVQGPAASALALAEWLAAADAEGILAQKLKTLRLLWLPSAAEKATSSPIAVAAGTAVDAASARNAIVDWRNDCRSHPENVALFYFGGHGINASADDVYLAMGDIGAPGDSPSEVSRCICVQNIFKAMAPSAVQMNMALTQFYFIDTCRTIDAVIDDVSADLKIGGNRLTSNDADAKRIAPIYFAADSGDPAFADSASGTRFGNALLSALKNSASADAQLDANNNLVYAVNTDSLRLAIKNAMGQELPVKGHAKSADLVWRRTPPAIQVFVEVRPADRAGEIRIDVINVDQGSLLHRIDPFDATAFPVPATVGRYRLEACWRDPARPFRPMPPRTFVGPIERCIVDARFP
jgi:hypothetical protein